MSDELKYILIKFSESGWDLIDVPAREYLNDTGNKETLITAIKQANEECGNCGCEFDALYKKALAILYTV